MPVSGSLSSNTSSSLSSLGTCPAPHRARILLRSSAGTRRTAPRHGIHGDRRRTSRLRSAALSGQFARDRSTRLAAARQLHPHRRSLRSPQEKRYLAAHLDRHRTRMAELVIASRPASIIVPGLIRQAIVHPAAREDLRSLVVENLGNVAPAGLQATPSRGCPATRSR